MKTPILKLEYTHLTRVEFVSPPQDMGYRWTEDLKDPCVARTAERVLHLYGSIGSSRVEEWEIFHATNTQDSGPWTVQPPVVLEGLNELLGRGVGLHIAAPAVVWDPEDAEFPFHMTVQTEFLAPGGKILHLRSRDGTTFGRPTVILDSVQEEGSDERGVYDPHFASIGGKKYLSYSAARRMEFLGDRYMADPDIFLAESVGGKWDGPWERRGRILAHEDIPHHNQREAPGYEWGLEGSQLVELPGGLVLLVAVCFKPDEEHGMRQRIFFAVSRDVRGPYVTLGIAIDPATVDAGGNGENGHAMAEMLSGVGEGGTLRLWHQGRPRPAASVGQHWTHRYADFPLPHVLEAAESALAGL